jgi:hypothetical protein
MSASPGAFGSSDWRGIVTVAMKWIVALALMLAITAVLVAGVGYVITALSYSR